MTKDCNILLLKTDKATHLHRSFNGMFSTGKSIKRPVVIGGNYKESYHMYITSDDKIKVGDWTMDVECGLPHGRLTTIDNEIELERYASGAEIKKVILSTDPDLGLPLISKEFIDTYVRSDNKGKPFKKVEVTTGEDLALKPIQERLLTEREVARLMYQSIVHGMGLTEPTSESSAKAFDRRVEKWIKNKIKEGSPEFKI
jgi:hypothetical protein